MQAPIPHMVVGNQITASLFPDIQLLITLCHSTPNSGSDPTPPSGEKPSPPAPPQADQLHSHVLEHSLYQLLRLQHQKNIDPDQVGLSTAPVGISKRRRMAGPSAASRKDLLEMAGTDTLLEQIIRQAQHILLRQRVAFVLDSMASVLKDPLISCHWGTISSPTKTSVKVSSNSIYTLDPPDRATFESKQQVLIIGEESNNIRQSFPLRRLNLFNLLGP